MLEQGSFWLSTTPDKAGSKGWDAALPRVAGWLKLKDNQTQATFYVVNAHFDHRGAEARRRSAELIVERVRGQFAAHPVIFMGDLNSVPDSPACEVLTAKVGGQALLRDASEHAAKKAGPDATWNGFEKIVPGSRIDYLFVTESFKLHELRTLTDQRDGRFPSDHLPIVVELEIR